MKVLRSLPPVDQSWSDVEEFATGNEYGSDLRIWWDDGQVFAIEFSYSPVVDEIALLGRFLDIVAAEGHLPIETASGTALLPDLAVIGRRIGESTAGQFAHDPTAALQEAAQLSVPC